MNYSKIIKTVLMRVLPIIAVIIAISFLVPVPMINVSNLEDGCFDNRMAKLQQRTKDCMLLTNLFEQAEKDVNFPADTDKEKIEKSRLMLHVMKEALLVELDCIYPEEMEFPK